MGHSGGKSPDGGQLLGANQFLLCLFQLFVLQFKGFQIILQILLVLLQPIDHPVEGSDELSDLILGGHLDLSAEIPLADLLGQLDQILEGFTRTRESRKLPKTIRTRASRMMETRIIL